MDIFERIAGLAMEYEIDLSQVSDQNKKGGMTPERNGELDNLPSNILIDIWSEYKGYSIVDSFLRHSFKYIKDKKRIRPLAYSLLTTVENALVDIREKVDRNKKELIAKRTDNRDDPRIQYLDDQINSLEKYHARLLDSKAFILMEIDNLKTQPQSYKKSPLLPKTEPAHGLRWVRQKNPILVNELYKSLMVNCLDQKTRFTDFSKLFQGKTQTGICHSINWIHRGGANSLCFLFFQLTKEHQVFTSTGLNKFIADTFTANGLPLNRNSLKTNFSRIKAGEYPLYYENLKDQIGEILRQSKVQ